MRRAIVGTALGVSAGILLAAISVVATTGWLIAFVIPLLLPPLFFAAAGWYVGLRLDRGRQPAKRLWLWLTVAVVSWPLCAVAPFWARQLQITRMIYREVPVHPSCDLVMQQITPVGTDDPPGFFLRYVCADKPEKVVPFYRAELEKLGWVAKPSVRLSNYVYHQFRKRGKVLSFITYSGSYPPDTRDRNWVQISCSLPTLTYSCPTLAELGNPVVGPDEWFESPYKPK